MPLASTFTVSQIVAHNFNDKLVLHNIAYNIEHCSGQCFLIHNILPSISKKIYGFLKKIHIINIYVLDTKTV